MHDSKKRETKIGKNKKQKWNENETKTKQKRNEHETQTKRKQNEHEAKVEKKNVGKLWMAVYPTKLAKIGLKLCQNKF